VILLPVSCHLGGDGIIALAAAESARVCQLARPFQSRRFDDGLIQDCPSAKERAPIVMRIGMPSSSISANLTPGRSFLSSKKAAIPASLQAGV
jgi:hypothetical protein